MNFTGTISKRTETDFGTVTVTDETNCFMAKVFVDNVELIRFPIVKSADLNEINLRICNVVYQTGFIDGPAKVTLNPV